MTHILNVAIETALRSSKLRVIARDQRRGDSIAHEGNAAFLYLSVTCAVKLQPFAEESNLKYRYQHT